MRQLLIFLMIASTSNIVQLKAQYNFNQLFGVDTLLEGFSATTPTQNGGFVAIGRVQPAALSFNQDYLSFIHLNTTGTILFQKEINLISHPGQYVQDILELEDGYLLAGSIYRDTIDYKLDAYLAKIDHQANIVWMKTYGGIQNRT